MLHTAINKKPDKRAKKPLDLVHSDLSGQLSPADKNGYQYAMVFVDDYSGMTFHYLLKNKSDVTRAMEKFIADVAPIGKIKRSRSDSGVSRISFRGGGSKFFWKSWGICMAPSAMQSVAKPRVG